MRSTSLMTLVVLCAGSSVQAVPVAEMGRDKLQKPASNERIIPSKKTFVHPGITHKKSDLDRMKYMVEAQIDPWYSSYKQMAADSKASYNYVVQGKKSFTLLARDAPRTNYRAWNSDIRAAYYNAIRWYVTGDSRHAEKAIEIFKAWSNLTAVTSNGTDALSGGVGYIMIEAAELIKSTYDGWSTVDINAFKDMLVYPGYSNTGVPSSVSRRNGTFYWKSYQGDSYRHGNQGLSGWRTVMAMGIFLDNEIMYDRALRYIKGLPHRSDDLPYPADPNTGGPATEDYGFNEVMTHYIWENGQCQESSRDQQHTVFGIGLLCSMAEMSWNQGEDLYGHANDRLLLGLEYNMRYNVSAIQTYPDQPTAWKPTVASGEFIQRQDRTGRWFSKVISTKAVGGYLDVRPVFEMPVAHYHGRGLKSADELKWTIRARDLQIEKSGYEAAGHSNDAIGWGALTARRPDYCYGDPISGFDSEGLPEYRMNVLPTTIEAENFDYSPVSGEGRIYHDTIPGNTGGKYRHHEDVDIEGCSEGGYCLSNMDDGEWMSYTVTVPASGTYSLTVRYAAANSHGKVKFAFDGSDATGDIALPATGGVTTWASYTVADSVALSKGVQSMRVAVSGTSGSYQLNKILIGSRRGR
ncbi:carbohydrate-binding protein [Planctomycetota bacterium]